MSNPMKIAMNTVVTMTYQLKNSDGEVLESSAEPVAYLHGGYDNIFPKVEEAMHGERVVFTATVTDVRKAIPEEISHQHVHGAGGHHH